MQKVNRKGNIIALLWFVLGLSELFWFSQIEIKLFMSFKEERWFLEMMIVSFCYFTTVLFALFGVLTVYLKMITFRIPSACSIAWGTVQVLIGMVYFMLGWFVYKAPINRYLFFVLAWNVFGFFYLFAGIVGLYFLKPSPDSANNSAPAIVGNDPAHS